MTDSLALDSVSRDQYVELDAGGRYIDSLFRAHLGGPAPRMGWFRGATFLASERHQRVAIYSADPNIGQAEFARVMGPGEHREVTSEHRLACGTEGPLGEYRLTTARDSGTPRALYTAQVPPQPVHVGFRFTPAGERDRESGFALLALGTTPSVRRDTIVSVGPGRPYYSVHAAYDSAAGTLLSAALVLHDGTGKVLGSNVTTGDDYGCDGCEPPSYEEGIPRLFYFLNGFQFTFFPHPVLLLDTSTFEGRALSLLTFTAEGKYAAYRVYEYVVNCVLGRDE